MGARQRRLYPAFAPGSLDDLGAQYAREARLYSQEIGRLDFAAPQDWMCEPWILRKTGLSVREHQKRTLSNFLELQDLAPDLPWIPVLQGWAVHDYWRHADMYSAAGVDLKDRPLVGALREQPVRAPDEQAGADEQRERERDLGHHERAAEPVAGGPAVSALPALLASALAAQAARSLR